VYYATEKYTELKLCNTNANIKTDFHKEHRPVWSRYCPGVCI